MGYYTDFHITHRGDDDFDKVTNVIEQESDYRFDSYGDGSLSINCKWYSFKEDMKVVSKKFPNSLFIVNGNGEEYQDIWRAVFKNGRAEHSEARIVFDDSKLEAEYEADKAIHEMLVDEQG